MNTRCILFLLSLMLLLLAGCASVAPPTSTPDTPARSTAPVAESGSSAEIINPEPAPKPAVSGNPAVIALVDRARLDSGAGQRDSAGAALERALRIEPRNPWLWQELAQLRLNQGQYAQAVSLAQKSMSFSGQDKPLRGLNWRIIGNARIAQGNAVAGEQAFKRAAELEQ
jgi:predicted Zn-dependent protease